jgi:hypothetical protein
MLVAYVLILLILVALQFCCWWRASGLEKKFVRLAGEVDELMKRAADGPKGGNIGGKPDATRAAMDLYRLAIVAQKRESAEERYTFWQTLMERFSGWRKALTTFRGKVSPYLAGIFDLSSVLVTLHMIGVDVERVRAVFGL